MATVQNFRVSKLKKVNHDYLEDCLTQIGQIVLGLLDYDRCDQLMENAGKVQSEAIHNHNTRKNAKELLTFQKEEEKRKINEKRALDVYKMLENKVPGILDLLQKALQEDPLVIVDMLKKKSRAQSQNIDDKTSDGSKIHKQNS